MTELKMKKFFTQTPMKKYILVGLGILLTSSVFAQLTVSDLADVINTKDGGDSVTHEEFNTLATGVNEFSDVFVGTVSDSSVITLIKEFVANKLTAPSLCINEICKTAWPSDAGIADFDCPAGEVMNRIADGTFSCIAAGGAEIANFACGDGEVMNRIQDGAFSCAADMVGGAGSDNLGNHIAILDIIPEMTGATPMIGDPSGPSIISQKNLGSATEWFRSLYVEDIHLGNQSLYMGTGTDEFKVLESDPGLEMRLYADEEQDMALQTIGANFKIELVNPTPGISGKDILIKNGSANGKIILESTNAFSGTPSIILDSPEIHFGGTDSADPNIEVLDETTGIALNFGIDNGAPTWTIRDNELAANVRELQITSEGGTTPVLSISDGNGPITTHVLGVGVNMAQPKYTLDVNGDINFTGALTQNGAAYGGGGGVTDKVCPVGEFVKAVEAGVITCEAESGGGTSLWSAATGGIKYSSGNVGINKSTPLTTLDVGGNILAEKFCINTSGVTDICSTKACAAAFESDPASGATCFTQQTLTDIEAALSGPTGDDDWLNPTFGGTPNSMYFGKTGYLGIGIMNATEKVQIHGGNIKISQSGGTGGDLIAEGSIQIGGHFCPAPGSACTKAGEVAACGTNSGILACAAAGGEWMPITSHNGTLVGSNAYPCNDSQKGTMKFTDGTAQALQICMKEAGTSTYGWRTIMSGGGNGL